MTTNGTDLLRMLEPAVRPVNVVHRCITQAVNQPFEKQDFDQLLQEAKLITAPIEPSIEKETEEGAIADTQTNILSELSRIDAVENASLRVILKAEQKNSL